MVAEQDRAAWQAQAGAAGLTLADLIPQRLGQAETVDRDPVKRKAARRADPALPAALGRLQPEAGGALGRHLEGQGGSGPSAGRLGLDRTNHCPPRPRRKAVDTGDETEEAGDAGKGLGPWQRRRHGAGAVREQGAHPGHRSRGAPAEMQQRP